MRRCGTVSEVAELWENHPRSSHAWRFLHNDWDFDTYAWCDRTGGMLMFEQTHSYMASLFRNPYAIDDTYKDIICHTNHHYFLDPFLTGSEVPGESYRSNSSCLRLERAYEILMMHYGNISIDTCINLTRDHERGIIEHFPDSSDICCHADGYDTFATAVSWVIHPQSFTIYLTHGQPCTSSFIVYNCTSMFYGCQ
jgi:hypothetical protein